MTSKVSSATGVGLVNTFSLANGSCSSRDMNKAFFCQASVVTLATNAVGSAIKFKAFF